MNIGLAVAVGFGETKRSPKVFDNFNRPDSATLGNAVTGQAWQSDTGGAWGITSQQAYNNSTTPTNAYIDSGLSDCTVKATFNVLGNFCAVSFRISDSSNFIRVLDASGAYQIVKKVAGSDTILGTSAVVPKNGDQIVLICKGSSITVYVNGAQLFSITETFNQTATKHGLRSSVTTSRFTNFKVEAM